MNAPLLTRVLRSYQQRAATYLYESDAAFLIAGLGSGKTAATLTAIADLIRDGHRRHALVVAPKLVSQTVWPLELQAWPHLTHLRVAVLDGSPAPRRERLATAPERDLTTISVDLAQWLCAELAAYPDDHVLFDLLVVDEVSKLKDPTGKRARALARIAKRFRSRWALTGTPRPNSSVDLFAPASIVTASKLWGQAFAPWRDKHFYRPQPIYQPWVWEARPGAEETIAAEFAAVAMQVADDDMPDLPPVNTVMSHVALPPEAAKLYDEMESTLLAEIDTGTVAASSSLVATGKCAQIANGFLYREDGGATRIHDVKLQWLRELVKTLDGEPLLIAYEFVEDLRAIKEILGDIPVLSAGGADYIDQWNAKALPLLAFHPASASHGLNLQHGGNHMAWLSPSWSSELTEQAIARIWRPGQTKRVTIHICVAKDTVDVVKYNRVVHKMSAQDAFKHYLKRCERDAGTHPLQAGDAAERLSPDPQ
jgi:SNF2-related domain